MRVMTDAHGDAFGSMQALCRQVTLYVCCEGWERQLCTESWPITDVGNGVMAVMASSDLHSLRSMTLQRRSSAGA